MIADKQIAGREVDFSNIFANEPKEVKKPIEWLILHNRKANKTALFTFLKLMLELDIFPREILRHANNLFKYGKQDIFPVKYSYPTKKEQKSSIHNHLIPIRDAIKKTRLS